MPIFLALQTVFIRIITVCLHNPDRYTPRYKVTTLTVTQDGQVGGGDFEKYYPISPKNKKIIMSTKLKPFR